STALRQRPEGARGCIDLRLRRVGATSHDGAADGRRPVTAPRRSRRSTQSAERLGIESVTTGLGWRRAVETVTVTGTPDKADIDACWELGATLAAGLTN
ncbi:hypothetical protein ACWD1Y_46665, partial [Streptomyces sp. NPDC002814]